ncbi:hypothetical protein AALO_G00018040 [Alosa alosa]|uniref:Uncharacterized protein n=1 Tax=Alosa alosa TaxID=278164 RepID=A0AAV6HMH7_9TELE|nr:hypothetical protein AALO_G00018040 [Alosa alosa]
MSPDGSGLISASGRGEGWTVIAVAASGRGEGWTVMAVPASGRGERWTVIAVAAASSPCLSFSAPVAAPASPHPRSYAPLSPSPSALRRKNGMRSTPGPQHLAKVFCSSHAGSIFTQPCHVCTTERVVFLNGVMHLRVK